MITELKDIPNTMVGFEVCGDIIREDFDNTVLPSVAELIKRTDKLNYLFITQHASEIQKLSSWLKEAMQTLNADNKWNRSAFVTTQNEYEAFAKVFTGKMNGELRRFDNSEIEDAIDWAGEQDGILKKSVLQEEGTKED